MIKVVFRVLMDKVTGDLALSWKEGGKHGPLRLNRLVRESRFSKGWTIIEPTANNRGFEQLGQFTETFQEAKT